MNTDILDLSGLFISKFSRIIYDTLCLYDSSNTLVAVYQFTDIWDCLDTAYKEYPCVFQSH